MPPEASCILNIRVQPRSSKNAVEIQSDGVLKVWTTAPPVEGEANSAVCGYLAKKLKLAGSKVSVISGDKGRSKRIHIEGLGESEALARLRA